MVQVSIEASSQSPPATCTIIFCINDKVGSNAGAILSHCDKHSTSCSRHVSIGIFCIARLCEPSVLPCGSSTVYTLAARKGRHVHGPVSAEARSWASPPVPGAFLRVHVGKAEEQSLVSPSGTTRRRISLPRGEKVSRCHLNHLISVTNQTSAGWARARGTSCLTPPWHKVPLDGRICDEPTAPVPSAAVRPTACRQTCGMLQGLRSKIRSCRRHGRTPNPRCPMVSDDDERYLRAARTRRLAFGRA